MSKDQPTNKSYKREMAAVLLMGLSWVVYQGDTEMVKLLVWPVFTFSAAAFGLDSYAKQIKNPAGEYVTDGDPSLRK